MESKDVLVVYATVYGQAELIARRIAAAAGEWGVIASVLDVKKVSAADLETHDAIVFVASVHYGRHPRTITRLIRKHRERIARVRTAFISVSGDASEEATRPRAETYVSDIFRATGWTASESMVTGGAIAFSKYNPIVRFIIRRIAASKGQQLDPRRDYDRTDWDAVLRFAKAFATRERVKVA